VRILVLTNLYPPAVLGGYEVECAAVVDHLRARGDDVHVLTSRLHADEAPPDPRVTRALTWLPSTWRGAVRAPWASLHDARVVRRELARVEPDLVFCWNAANVPWAVVRIALDTAPAVAFRVCEAWFGRLFAGDQVMRHLLPGDRGARRVWAQGVRLLNRHPALGLDPRRRARAAVSWNSEALRAHAGMPAVIEPALERVVHSVAVRGAAFAGVPREPAGGGPLIAFAGRVDGAKGADVAARAVARLRDEHGMPARLLLAGVVPDGWRARLEALAPAEALEFAGLLTTDELARVLGRADALVIPSTTFDAFPQICLEGALARVPIVAAAIGGIPECLHDEEHALLHPPGDDAALAAALARTFADPEATAARVARARQRADELGLEPYLEASAAFADAAVAALRKADHAGLREVRGRSRPNHGSGSAAERGP
jgi:glycogen(starch) synthase